MHKFEANEDEDLDIDVEDLNREFRRIGPLLYRYSKLKAEAQSKLEFAELSLKEVKSDIYLELKKSNPEMKDTERKHEIELDEDVQRIYREVISLKRDVETLKGFTEALKAKKDMLIQLGADSRRE